MDSDPLTILLFLFKYHIEYPPRNKIESTVNIIFVTSDVFLSAFSLLVKNIGFP